MIDDLFKSNPTAWFVAFLVVGVVLFLAVKYRFWLLILKLIVVLLIALVLLFVVKPFLLDYFFDPQLIVDWFWKITPNVYDDFYAEITFALDYGLPFIVFLLIGFVVKGKKRADPEHKSKVRVEVE